MANVRVIDDKTNVSSLPGAKFSQMSGMILMRRHWTFNPDGRPDYVWGVFKRVQKHNLLFGWWSIYAWIINPFLLIGNTVAWFQYKSDYKLYTIDPKAYHQRALKRARHGGTWLRIFLYAVLGFFAFIVLILLIVVLINH